MMSVQFCSCHMDDSLLPFETESKNYKDFRSHSIPQSRRKSHFVRWGWKGRNSPQRFKMTNFSTLMEEIGSELYVEKDSWKSGYLQSGWTSPRVKYFVSAPSIKVTKEEDDDEESTNKPGKKSQRRKRKFKKASKPQTLRKIPTIENVTDFTPLPNPWDLSPSPLTQKSYPSLSHTGSKKRYLYKTLAQAYSNTGRCPCPMCTGVWRQDWKKKALLEDLKKFFEEGGLCERWERGGKIDIGEIIFDYNNKEIEEDQIKMASFFSSRRWDCLVERALETWEEKRRKEAQQIGWEWFEERWFGLYTVTASEVMTSDDDGIGTVWSFADEDETKNNVLIRGDSESDGGTDSEWDML